MKQSSSVLSLIFHLKIGQERRRGKYSFSVFAGLTRLSGWSCWSQWSSGETALSPPGASDSEGALMWRGELHWRSSGLEFLDHFSLKNNNILKVFVGGASEGLLQVGDRILSINNSNAQSITHFEAQHLFK